jgi:hypothetical protein
VNDGHRDDESEIAVHKRVAARRHDQGHQPEELLTLRARATVARADWEARGEPHDAEQGAERADDRQREAVLVEVERKEQVLNALGRGREKADEVCEKDPATEQLGAQTAVLRHAFFGPLQRGKRSCLTPS